MRLSLLVAGIVSALTFSACQPVDNDELPTDPLKVDGDGDGFSLEEGDCADDDATRHPDAIESCNRVDDNCDGTSDEGFDVDGDTFTVCGTTETTADCDDTDDGIFPGGEEVCDGKDNDCDGAEDDPFDRDGDGVVSCAVGGEVADCDDDDPLVAPGATEKCDGVDNDCDRDTDEGFDDDEDGWVSCSVDGEPADCDDRDEDINPGEKERCDGEDNDCDDDIDEDFDKDEDGFSTCSSEESPDCNDSIPLIHPGAPEQCNGQDDNCDGSIDEGFDQDEDGYYLCASQGKAADCDEADPNINPAGTEVCNDKDDDCDKQKDEGLSVDKDGDSFPICQSGTLSDCDDKDEDVNPGQAELCDGVDEDCDGSIDEDFDKDKDGYASCNPDIDLVDCDDKDENVNPGQPELCDGLDQDCDEMIDEDFDKDGDGYTTCTSSGDEIDCDDSSSVSYPGAIEICNGRDDNCDGTTDEGFDVDKDGFNACGSNGKAADCVDTDPQAYPGNKSEPCDGVDNNCSGGGGDLYVSGDLAIAPDYRTIQSAISAAGPSCVIVVGDGTYLERIDFLGKAITVRSEHGPETTIINGATTTASNSPVVTFRRQETRSSVIEGFTITGGTGDTTTFENAAPIGGGVFLYVSSGPTVRGNIISTNTAQLGAGVGCYACNDALLEDNVILENHSLRVRLANGHGAGFIILGNGSIEFQSNTFRENLADSTGGCGYIAEGIASFKGDIFESNSAAFGAGVYASVATVGMRGIRAEGNTSTGEGTVLYMAASSVFTVEDSSFVNNHSDKWAAVVYATAAEATFSRNRFEGNSAVSSTGDTSTGFGGVGLLTQSFVDFDQNVFYDNTCTVSGGALYLQRSGGHGDFVLTNNIFAGNEAGAGGALFLDLLTADSRLINNTFADNLATTNGGTLYVNGSTSILDSNIFAYTIAKAALYYVEDGVAYLPAGTTYNDFYFNGGGNYAGSMSNPVGANGNIEVDPLFVSAPDRDYRLQIGSQVENAGNPARSDVDGSICEPGAFGGPWGDWDPDSVGVLTSE